MILNPSQERAVRNHGHQIILAGPGSGKTWVITEKILDLISHDVSPSSILALTFSEKAAKEMQERLEERTDTHDLIVSMTSMIQLERGRDVSRAEPDYGEKMKPALEDGRLKEAGG